VTKLLNANQIQISGSDECGSARSAEVLGAFILKWNVLRHTKFGDGNFLFSSARHGVASESLPHQSKWPNRVGATRPRLLLNPRLFNTPSPSYYTLTTAWLTFSLLSTAHFGEDFRWARYSAHSSGSLCQHQESPSIIGLRSSEALQQIVISLQVIRRTCVILNNKFKYPAGKSFPFVVHSCLKWVFECSAPTGLIDG
jgi:hypothetical protein